MARIEVGRAAVLMKTFDVTQLRRFTSWLHTGVRCK